MRTNRLLTDPTGEGVHPLEGGGASSEGGASGGASTEEGAYGGVHPASSHPPPREQNDRRLWKHYLPHIPYAVGKNKLWPSNKFNTLLLTIWKLYRRQN